MTLSIKTPIFCKSNRKKTRIFVDSPTEKISKWYRPEESARNVKYLHEAFQPFTWMNYDSDGQCFQSRSGHDAITFGSSAYVFGGCAGPAQIGTLLNDIKVFDFNKRKWKNKKTCGNGPAARASFAMCKGPSSTSFIISGGTGEDQVFGDMFEFDVKTSIWRELVADTDDSPCKFYGQSMCCHKKSLFFFGGSTGYSYSNATYEFHIPSRTWRRLPTTGEIPPARYQHTATIIGNSMLVTGGGNFRPVSKNNDLEMYLLNLETLEWSALKVEGFNPKARVSHTADYDPACGCLFLGGGFDRDLERLRDFFILDLNSTCLQWQCITNMEQCPNSRAFHASCLCNGALWLLGGADGENRFNDTWRYQYNASPPSLTNLAGQTLVDSNAFSSNKVCHELPLELQSMVKEIESDLTNQNQRQQKKTKISSVVC
mmetsp:Transcript_35716/g.47121  ORF Transcript_35716/g.47121 Transcript_35716/m.47121 type:complete len:429 (-) Transcript_35716:15-1301(-)